MVHLTLAASGEHCTSSNGGALELSGANMFRTRSYQNASRLIGSLSQDLGELVASGEIFNLKGIGKGLGTAISQAVGEGDWPQD